MFDLGRKPISPGIVLLSQNAGLKEMPRSSVPIEQEIWHESSSHNRHKAIAWLLVSWQWFNYIEII